MSSLLTEGDLTHEAHVVRLENPENLDYVRQALDKTPRRRNKPHYARDGRMVGYAELDDHAEADSTAASTAAASSSSSHTTATPNPKASTKKAPPERPSTPAPST
jgi:hypothetical protein